MCLLPLHKFVTISTIIKKHDSFCHKISESKYLFRIVLEINDWSDLVNLNFKAIQCSSINQQSLSFFTTLILPGCWNHFVKLSSSLNYSFLQIYITIFTRARGFFFKYIYIYIQDRVGGSNQELWFNKEYFIIELLSCYKRKN